MRCRLMREPSMASNPITALASPLLSWEEGFAAEAENNPQTSLFHIFF